MEGSDLIEYEVWEEMVMKRSELMDMSNDIKLIGELNDIMENLALVPAMIFLSYDFMVLDPHSFAKQY